MTRWARVHSTHRTQKQPEEATPWNEFHKQKGQPDQESSISEKSETVKKGIHRDASDKRRITDEERRRLKKEKLVAKMREEREAKGMVLLPEKIEKKIYRIKKAMRAKGKSEEEIKQEIRQFRRKEELAFRKLCAKACLNCRQPGHKVAECPKSPRIGICYKCGAVDHTSSNCLRTRNTTFDFATCFVCGVQGHISRECPKNEKGAFPKGGGCRFCGSNKHRKQECPERKRQKSDHEGEEVVADVVIDAKESTEREELHHNLTSTAVKSSAISGISQQATMHKAVKVVKFL